MSSSIYNEPNALVTVDQTGLDRVRASVLKSQISTYRLLARNLPVSDHLISSCSYQTQLASYLQSQLNINEQQLPQTTSTAIVLTDREHQNVYQTFPSATVMYKTLVGLENTNNDNEQPSTRRQEPQISFNPLHIQQDREKRVLNRISNRLNELEQMPAQTNDQLNIRALIELKSLKLLTFQKQLRNEMLTTMKKDTGLQTSLNPRSYKRPKRHLLREARTTEQYERQKKLEQEHRQKQKHNEFINQILIHVKEFRDFHRRTQYTTQRISKAVVLYFANSERELKKEQERNEKERIRRLMNEDEEGYRKLIDEKKDARLALLLSQTDAYIDNLKQLVRQHQQDQKVTNRQRGRPKAVTKQDPNLLLAEQKSLSLDEPKPLIEAIPIVNEPVPIETDIQDQSIIVPEEVEESTKLTPQPSTTNVVIDQTGNDEAIRDAVKQTATNEDDEYDAKESYYALAHRIREPILEQSKLLVGGQLKPYQLQGLEWLVSLYNNNLNGILADEMGLGKTIQTIALIVYLLDSKKNPGPSLIIVPLSTLSNWSTEFQRWAPDISVIQYKGTPQVRKMLSQSIRTSRFNVLLTTYEYIMRDRSILSKVPWKYLIVDEGHRMKNHHCKLTQILNTYYVSAPHRLLLTGTPLQNNLPELWALLNFILPTIFKSATTFTDWFNAPFATLPSEKVELNHEETLLIIRRLHKVLRPFLLRRLKKEVESQLPEKVEYVIKCEMSALQRLLYVAMSKNRVLLTENPNGKTGRRALMNKIMQLRKICNHPFLFESIEDKLADSLGYKYGIIDGPDLFRVSGKFELLDRILPKLKATGHKILLFCQMTAVMNKLEIYFAYRNYTYLRLDGTTKSEDRCELLKNFNDDRVNCFIFLLSTRAGGVGLNLQKADTVILFDSDWNPHQDQQAQDRAHRIGQKNEVRVLRLMSVNTIEEKILACAKYKLNVDEKVIQAGMFNRSSTSSERQQFLEQILVGDDEEQTENPVDDEDLPDDETINQMIARTEHEFNLFNRMDIARREYEAKYGVGSGGDGANERRVAAATMAEDDEPTITSTADVIKKTDKKLNISKSTTKRKKIKLGDDLEDEISENDDSNDTPRESNRKLTTSFLDQSDEEMVIDSELNAAKSDDEEDILDDDLEDEDEEVDDSSQQPKPKQIVKHRRKMKTNRLITEDELPDWLKQNVDEVEQSLENEDDFGKGRRQRKDVDYSDNLTEREFLIALEEGNLDDVEQQKRQRKQTKKLATDALLDIDDDDVDSTPQNITTTPSSQQSTQRQQRNTNKLRGSVKKRRQNMNPKILQQCKVLLDKLIHYRDSEGRQLAQPFIRLPGQKQLPIYYQTITDPIDFNRIRRRIETYRYITLDDFEQDIVLLCKNAQTFNIETSLIYTDSIELEKIFQNLRKQLENGEIDVNYEQVNVHQKISFRRGGGTSGRRGGASGKGKKRPLSSSEGESENGNEDEEEDDGLSPKTKEVSESQQIVSETIKTEQNIEKMDITQEQNDSTTFIQ